MNAAFDKTLFYIHLGVFCVVVVFLFFFWGGGGFGGGGGCLEFRN